MQSIALKPKNTSVHPIFFGIAIVLVCAPWLFCDYSGLAAKSRHEEKSKPSNKDWKAVSISTEQLLAAGKFVEAESTLRRIIPVAQKMLLKALLLLPACLG